MLSAKSSCCSARIGQYSRSAAAPHRPLVVRSSSRKADSVKFYKVSSSAVASSTSCELLKSPAGAPITNHHSYQVASETTFIKDTTTISIPNDCNDSTTMKHSQLFLVLAPFSAATAFAEAGPVGWGGLLVLGSMMASWLVPGIPKAICTHALQQLVGAFKSRGQPSTKPHSAPLAQVPAAASPTIKPSPISHPLVFTSHKNTTRKAEASKDSTQLPAGQGMKTVASHAILLDSKEQQDEEISSTAELWSSQSAPTVTAAVKTAVASKQAAPLQVKSAAVASFASSAPGGEAHAAEQVAMPVSSTMRVALLAICLRLAPEETRKQPGGLIYSSSDLALAPGGSYWCNAGNAERLAKVQGQVQNDFLPASAADDSGLPRLEVSSMADIFKQQWKALRVYATTPSGWPTEGKLVTFGDLQVVAAYGIQG